jgi:4-hydroxybenzoate polyprenyltransferase
VRRKAVLLVRISRPAGWLLAPLVFLLGFTAFGAQLNPAAISQLVLLTVPYCILLYGTNDIYDYEADKLNPRKTVPTGAAVEAELFPLVKKLSTVTAVLLLASSLISLNLFNVIAMLLLLVFSHQYSAPPLRFKERPPLDSFSNGIIYYYAPLLLGVSYGAGFFDIPLGAYYILACVMGIHSFSTVMDYGPDKLAGDKTFAVAFGKRAASLFTAIVFTIAFLFSGFQGTAVACYLLFCVTLSGIITVAPSEQVARYFFYAIGLAFIVVAVFEVQRYLTFFH